MWQTERTKIRKTECTQEVCYNAQFLRFFQLLNTECWSRYSLMKESLEFQSHCFDQPQIETIRDMKDKSVFWPASHRRDERHEGQSQHFHNFQTELLSDTFKHPVCLCSLFIIPIIVCFTKFAWERCHTPALSKKQPAFQLLLII